MTITVHHTDGPLSGQTQVFDDTVNSIVFGRDQEVAQVVYPPHYDVVGRRHFELRRTRSGDYAVELFGSRYVEMNGAPAYNGAPVPEGSTFRLGRKDGPAFEVEIGAPSVQGLPVTGDQREMTTSTYRLARIVALAGGGLVLLVVAIGAYLLYLGDSLSDKIALARAEAADQAAKEFRQADLNTLQDAVYLVARDDDGVEDAEGTAFAFERGDPETGKPGRLATNAHVTEAMKGREGEFFLVGPAGEKLDIVGVMSHPGYMAFKGYKKTQGTTRWGEFTPLDLINEYDVGIIEVAPSARFPATVAFAAPMDLAELAPGTPVAAAGFPVEGLAGSDTATKAPSTLQFGHISALMDVFMVRAEPEHRFLIQHSVPVTGGASGSPLMAPSGKVIGIVNGGNTTVFKNADAINAKVRVPSAALVNFAQRIDLLAGLAPCEPEDLFEEDAICRAENELTEHRTYWDAKAAQFDDYFDVAKANFVKLAQSRYDVGEARQSVIDGGTEAKLTGSGGAIKLVSRTYAYDVEPGKIYGFIADSKGGIPIGINLKDRSTSKFLRDTQDPRKTSELELAPTAWLTVDEPRTIDVVVWSFAAQPAAYELFAYEWPDPASISSVDASF